MKDMRPWKECRTETGIGMSREIAGQRRCPAICPYPDRGTNPKKVISGNIFGDRGSYPKGRHLFFKANWPMLLRRAPERDRVLPYALRTNGFEVAK